MHLPEGPDGSERQDTDRRPTPPHADGPAPADDSAVPPTGESAQPVPSSGEPIPGENPDDDVLPLSPRRRRLATYLGILFILVIIGFLVLFVATHTEQSENGSMFGRIDSELGAATVA